MPWIRWNPLGVISEESFNRLKESIILLTLRIATPFAIAITITAPFRSRAGAGDFHPYHHNVESKSGPADRNQHMKETAASAPG
ncbi:unnamed protein product [Danaus chrysippus]|uniref:(African queen) hypothetical protein n=1 Tax=Danaus chrysippus TaxID=151541 RepID=A0A8J2R407_9NEOP|nr:unnamed protein product [Danaus chrysippus]